MKRRTFLASTGGGIATGGAGCIDSIPEVGLDVDFERVAVQYAATDPPRVTLEDETVVVEGTVEYGSSDCARLELTHAEYEGSQDRLDVLVAGVDVRFWRVGGCHDDLVSSGYRVEATRDGGFRYVSATEHHAFGHAYSTSMKVR